MAKRKKKNDPPNPAREWKSDIESADDNGEHWPEYGIRIEARIIFSGDWDSGYTDDDFECDDCCDSSPNWSEADSDIQQAIKLLRKHGCCEIVERKLFKDSK